MIRAILWAQWKSIRILRFGSGRRSAIFSAITSALWYGLWTVAAVGLASFTADPNLRQGCRGAVPRGSDFCHHLLAVGPHPGGEPGRVLDLKKLLAYPVPTSRLFWIEVMLRVTTGIEMLLILTAGAIGLILNPRFGGWAKAPRIIAPLLVFVVFNLLLASGIRGLIERLLSRRHLREIFVAVIVMLSALPQLLVVTGVPRGALQRLSSQQSSVLCPWIAATRIALYGSTAASWAVLLAWTAAAYCFGRWQFESNLRFDSQAAQASNHAASAFSEDSWRTRLFRLPSVLLPDPVGAIVEKELRTLARTPRFRLVFILGFTFGLVVWLPLIFGRRAAGVASIVGDNFLTLVCLYALALLGQVTYWNAFGFDRSAAQAYFVLPAPISRALVGKNLAAGVFVISKCWRSPPPAFCSGCIPVRKRFWKRSW